jgi:hypothetical protein
MTDKTLSLAGLAKEVQRLVERVEAIEAHMPGDLRAMPADMVKEAIKQDPYVRFEVLTNWVHQGTRFNAGTIVRADQQPRLVDYIRHGLKLGVPLDHEKYLTKLNAERLQREELAKTTALLAKVAADAAMAQAHAESAKEMSGED